MEDILASIRRIIAEDQSNSLGRSGLGGLTRRSQPVTPAPAAEEAVLPPSVGDASLSQAAAEPDLHAGPHGDVLHQAYEPAAAVPHATTQEPASEEAIAAFDLQSFAGEPAYEALREPARDEQADALLAVAAGEEEGEPLMSPVAGASITSSFQTLAESVVLQDPGLIERVMREAMRPLLKSWLDDHLPSIVERLVRTEIERVARGGRGRNA